MTKCTRLLPLTIPVLMACSTVSTGPVLETDADVRILFIGNSLTYTHDVPRLVGELAALHGLSVATAGIAYPDYALEDHWYNGIADDIRRLRADIVVMQQGPSSLPESRTHLVYWSEQLATVIREAGGEPALYMVWPDASRQFAFGAVGESYADAAQTVGGRLLPAGTTWLRAWDQDPQLQLYAKDGLHASYIGALAAAQTIFAGLFDVDPATIPALDDDVSAARVDLLRAAVAASLEQWDAAGSMTHTTRLQR
jgi:hypothetical protein